jgi:hypothetical protein
MPAAPSRVSDYPFVIVCVGCQFSPRSGAFCLAQLAAKYGPEIDLWALLNALASDCRPRHTPTGGCLSSCRGRPGWEPGRIA